MNEVTISIDFVSQIVKKRDVWLVYTKNDKCWVCEINGIIEQDDFYILKLATKGKGGYRG